MTHLKTLIIYIDYLDNNFSYLNELLNEKVFHFSVYL